MIAEDDARTHSKDHEEKFLSKYVDYQAVQGRAHLWPLGQLSWTISRFIR